MSRIKIDSFVSSEAWQFDEKSVKKLKDGHILYLEINGEMLVYMVE